MTLEQAKQIIAAVNAAPPRATYTHAQVLEALKIVSASWGIPQ